MAYDEVNPQDIEEQARAMGQVISRTWTDPEFKARFVSEPEQVLAEAGIDTPEGMELRVVENTDDVMYLTLPVKPSEELSDDMLEAVAGGSTAGTASTLGTAGTVGTPILTMGTVSSAGTAGSAG